MPSSEFKTKLDPSAKALRARWKHQIDELKNLKTVYTKVSIFLDSWVQKNFKTEGDKVGGWRKLALGGRYVGTGKNKRFDSSAKLLQDTGRLRASFLPFASNKNAGIGSDLPYSKQHDEGLKGLPKRRILPKDREVWPTAEKIIDKHIMDSLK